MGWDALPGWFDFDDIYDQAVEEAKDGAGIVEVGVAFGRSIAYLTRKVIDSKKKNVCVYGVDPFVDDWVGHGADAHQTWGAEHAEWARGLGGPFNAFCHGMREHASEELERIAILRTYSAHAVHMFEERSLDLVFIDGDHSYEAVQEDIEVWLPCIRPGGVIAGHDYTANFPGVQRAAQEAFGDRIVTRRSSWWVRL